MNVRVESPGSARMHISLPLPILKFSTGNLAVVQQYIPAPSLLVLAILGLNPGLTIPRRMSLLTSNLETFCNNPRTSWFPFTWVSYLSTLSALVPWYKSISSVDLPCSLNSAFVSLNKVYKRSFNTYSTFWIRICGNTLLKFPVTRSSCVRTPRLRSITCPRGPMHFVSVTFTTSTHAPTNSNASLFFWHSTVCWALHAEHLLIPPRLPVRCPRPLEPPWISWALYDCAMFTQFLCVSDRKVWTHASHSALTSGWRSVTRKGASGPTLSLLGPSAVSLGSSTVSSADFQNFQNFLKGRPVCSLLSLRFDDFPNMSAASDVVEQRSHRWGFP